MTLQITILGCGSSGGVPRVAQGWGACDPTEPRNRRRRCSILVERVGATGRTQVLVDTTPDLREQLLGIAAERIDAILLTHAHADHIHGIDDIRPLVLKMGRRIKTYMDAETSAVVTRGFGYVFQTPPGSSYPSLLDEHRIESGIPINLEGPGGALEALPFTVHHGEIDALGYRFGKVAYTPDLNSVPDRSLPFLEGLDIWIVDALRYARHPSHLSLSETLDWIVRLQPKRAILTNLNTELDYGVLKQRLPANVDPAFDGMVVHCP